MIITLTPAPRNRVKVECDNPVFCDVVNLESEKHRLNTARKLGIDPNWFLGKPEGTHVYERPVVTLSITARVRDMHNPASGETATGDPVDVITTAVSLKTDFPNPIVEWNDAATACFLDVDYHHTTPPGSARLRFIMARLQPQPVLWFESRNGGVHALYVKQGNIPADVLCAVASFAYRTIDPTGVFDIMPRSRLPQGEVHRTGATVDLNAVRRFLTAGIDEVEVERWLMDRGLSRGMKKDHTHCPVDPTVGTEGFPVWFGENGVRCHRCEAKGIVYGSRYPGFFPYSSVIGSHGVNDVALMVKNFTHYTHAEVVLDAKCRLKGKHARLAYEGMLRLVHGDDDRIDRVFSVGEYLLRGNGKWVTPDRYETIVDCRSTLATLPAVCDRTGKPRAERLDLFDNTVDISRYGYLPIRPVHGMRVFGEYLGESSAVSVVLPPVNLPPGLQPKYVRDGIDLETAWSRVETVFPGINRNYLLLLIAARGVAEAESGMPANIMCVGPSSTGKTSIALLAASMLGDHCGEAVWTANTERFRQAYMAACDKGMFVVVNEIFKNAKQVRMPPRAAMDTFLNITPGSMSHAMYVGPVSIGRLPVTIVTDTSVPPEVRSDLQLGRRFVYVRLDARRDWEETFVANGIGQDCNFRAISPDAAEACNAIVSHVIDRWFRERPMTLREIAEDLGFSTLEHSDEISEDPDAIPRLFEEVCKAPEHHDSRHRGKGWRKICFDDETTLAIAYQAVCDGLNNYEAFSNSRKCMETDLSTLLPVPVGTRVQISKAPNRSIVIRFVCGETRGKGEYFVNEELKTCEGERR